MLQTGIGIVFWFFKHACPVLGIKRSHHTAKETRNWLPFSGHFPWGPIDRLLDLTS